MKSIIILGAGIMQIPAIKTAFNRKNIEISTILFGVGKWF